MTIAAKLPFPPDASTQKDVTFKRECRAKPPRVDRARLAPGHRPHQHAPVNAANFEENMVDALGLEPRTR
jgi:hypothetical protein